MNADNNDLIPMGAPASEFTIVMRGYERNQVNDAISRLEDDLRTIIAERDQAVLQANDAHARAEQVAVELDELKNELRHTQAPTFETMGGRIASMLRLAEEEASDIRTEAEKDADATRAAAQAEREETDQQIASDRAEADQYVADRRAEADEVLAKAQADATERLDTSRKLAEETVSTAQSEATRLTAESEAHRNEAEEDFKITLASRRREADREEQERDRQSRADAAARIQASKDEAATRIQASRDESDAMLTQAHADATAAVDEANARSRTIITEAEDEVNRLEKLRSALAQQFMQVGQLISNVPAYLAKAPEDLPVDRDVDAPSASAPTAPALYSGDRADEFAADGDSGSSEPGTDEAIVQPTAVEDADADASVAADPEDTAVAEALAAADTADDSGEQFADRVAPPTAADRDEPVADQAEDDPTLEASVTAQNEDGSSAAQSEADDDGEAGSESPSGSATPEITLTRRRGSVATEQHPVQVSAIRQRRKR